MTIKERNKQYYSNNKKRLLKKANKYNSKHRQQRKLYKLKNKYIIKIKNHEWYLKNRVRIIKYGKQYRKNHEKELMEKQKIYKENKYKIDINFKLAGRLRIRIWYALKKNIKSESTLKLLGCSLDFFRLYLQSKFQPGMSFSNYGKWHIDHIKPCVSFDLSKSNEQRKCFNYKNLQPLWAEDNLRKNDRVLGE